MIDNNGEKNPNYKHGYCGTKPYYIWIAMKQRCHNPNNKNYDQYGKRGISVCKKWRKGFKYFWDDMADGYIDGLTIDRINNDGDYCKENCRWVSRKKQGRNTRNNIYLTHNGRTMLLIDWAKEVNIHKDTLRGRLNRGWSDKDIIQTPVLRHRYQRIVSAG